MKYRIKVKRRWLYNEILVQEKRWWGWKSIAAYHEAFNGLADAERLINQLLESSRLREDNNETSN